jgi:hypothetical protein
MPDVVELPIEQVGKLSVFNMTVGVDGHESETSASGSTIVKRVEIFKAGTFTDAFGEAREWTLEHLLIMVNNFNNLRSSDKFPNVPMRRDHSWSIDGVIGYIANLAVEGETLVADLEFTEPEDFDKFSRGTYRSRSIEIGAYEDNDGITYWPVVMGLAFVDIPAVEGLHRAAGRPVASYTLQRTKEPDVPDKPAEPEKFVFSLNGQETTDYAAVNKYIARMEGELTAERAKVATLEAFATEQKTTARHNFVSALATDKKVAATQVDGLKALVESLSDEQWEAFQKSYDNAPVNSLLGEHTDGVTNPNGDTQTDPRKAEIDTLEEILSLHRKSGLSDDAIARTKSAQRLAALKGA